MASDPSAIIPVAGDLSVNPGIWVRQILAAGPSTFGRFTTCALEALSFGQMLDMWSEVTGKPAVYVRCGIEEWTALWGAVGNEIALQFAFGEAVVPWELTDEFITPAELGIDEAEVVGFRATIEGLNKAGLF